MFSSSWKALAKIFPDISLSTFPSSLSISPTSFLYPIQSPHMIVQYSFRTGELRFHGQQPPSLMLLSHEILQSMQIWVRLGFDRRLSKEHHLSIAGSSIGDLADVTLPLASAVNHYLSCAWRVWCCWRYHLFSMLKSLWSSIYPIEHPFAFHYKRIHPSLPSSLNLKVTVAWIHQSNPPLSLHKEWQMHAYKADVCALERESLPLFVQEKVFLQPWKKIMHCVGKR